MGTGYCGSLQQYLTNSHMRCRVGAECTHHLMGAQKSISSRWWACFQQQEINLLHWHGLSVQTQCSSELLFNLIPSWVSLPTLPWLSDLFSLFLHAHHLLELFFSPWRWRCWLFSSPSGWSQGIARTRNGNLTELHVWDRNSDSLYWCIHSPLCFKPGYCNGK